MDYIILSMVLDSPAFLPAIMFLQTFLIYKIAVNAHSRECLELVWNKKVQSENEEELHLGLLQMKGQQQKMDAYLNLSRGPNTFLFWLPFQFLDSHALVGCNTERACVALMLDFQTVPPYTL